MANYTILSDYEKQRKLKEITDECLRLAKPKYWVLRQMGISKSTYYDWVACGGISQSKAPKVVWNKTMPEVEQKIIELRDSSDDYKSKRTPVGIARELEAYNIFMTSTGVWKVLKRHGKNREFTEPKKYFTIYPRSEKFFGVVCIDDVVLTNWKPGDLAVFNAIDEFSQASVGILFVRHKVNRHDVISLLEQIKINYGRLPEIVRLDNAKAHISRAVKQYCLGNNIKLQFIDPGTPQQNWPVESFNGVLKKDLIKTELWKWDNLDDKQEMLEKYRDYYNGYKPLNSDQLKRTPNEIATAITSRLTQMRLKFRLLRKRRGQTIARKAIFNIQIISLPVLSEMCVN